MSENKVRPCKFMVIKQHQYYFMLAGYKSFKTYTVLNSTNSEHSFILCNEVSLVRMIGCDWGILILHCSAEK